MADEPAQIPSPTETKPPRKIKTTRKTKVKLKTKAKRKAKVKKPARRKERRKDDAYYTPPWPVRLLLQHWSPPYTEGIWVEPAVGSGNIVRAMNEKYPNATWRGYDINPTGRAAEPGRISNLQTTKTNFLAYKEVCQRVSLSMSNPPFSLADKFLAHMRFLYPHAYLMLLLRLGFMASAERAPLWAKYGEPDLFTLANRPSYTEDGAKDKYDYAWYGFPVEPRKQGTIIHLPHMELEERQKVFGP
jgi:hypothetical protein